MSLYAPAPGWDDPDAGRCRPGMVALRDHIIDRFSADNLGCFNPRAVTGGNRPSLHRDGRALDLGFAGRPDRREECANWLVEHAGLLGVQMLLVYRDGDAGGWRWRLPYRPYDSDAGRGTWHKAGHWVHVELLPEQADDPNLLDRLNGDDDMHILATPERVYDSRRDGGAFAAGETRRIPIGMAHRAHVRVTGIGLESHGWAAVAGTEAGTDTSIANWQRGTAAGGSAPVATPEGHVWVTVSDHGRAHVIVDVFARGA